MNDASRRDDATNDGVDDVWNEYGCERSGGIIVTRLHRPHLHLVFEARSNRSEVNEQIQLIGVTSFYGISDPLKRKKWGRESGRNDHSGASNGEAYCHVLVHSAPQSIAALPID